MSSKTSTNYKRRSGIVIHETLADQTLLDVVDTNTESIRDLALVGAFIAKASPKLFGYLKIEMNIEKPNITTIVNTLKHAHAECYPNIKSFTYEPIAPAKEEYKNVAVSKKTKADVREVSITNNNQVNIENSSIDNEPMPMLKNDAPVKRKGISRKISF